MASSYSKQLKVPLDFPKILKDFTREVLRDQPEIPLTEAQILTFAAKYFDKLQKNQYEDYEEENTSEPKSVLLSMTDDDINFYVKEIFSVADIDHSGTIDHAEFHSICNSMTAHLKLSHADIQKLYAQIDEDENGTIEYTEFLPLAVDILTACRASDTYKKSYEERMEKAQDEARETLVHGMPREQLMGILTEIFNRADTDQSGFLSRSECMACIKDADLGFSRVEINVLMSHVDSDGDNLVSYAEFVPMCFELLVAVFASDVLDVPRDEAALQARVLNYFQAIDASGSGLLSVGDLKSALRSVDLGLTRIQISALMAEVTEESDGMVAYTPLVRTLSGIMLTMVSTDQTTRMQHMETYRQSSAYHQICGYNSHEFQLALTTALASLETVTTKSALETALNEAFSELTTRQCRALVSLAGAVEDGSGRVTFDNVLKSGFEMLQYLQENDELNQEE